MLKAATKAARLRIENRGPQYVSRRAIGTANRGVSLFSNVLMTACFDAFSSNGLIYQIVSRQATAAAEATWALYKVGAEDPIESEHPALTLWKRPNPYIDQNEFVKQAIQHLLLVGECDWFVSQETTIGGRTLRLRDPAELWAVRPDRLEPVTHPVNYLDGWAYRNPDGQWEPWRIDQVLHTKQQPDPKNPYRGLGAMSAVMSDLYNDRAATEYQNAFWRNDGASGDIIRFPERLSDEEFDEFVARWNQQHQGPSNANKIGFIEVAEYHERKNNMREMQFVEGRKQVREFMREGFGYPVAMLGTTEDVNKAAAQAAELIFKNRMVRPLLNDLKEALNTKLLPRFGESGKGLEFRFETPDLADKELEIAELDSQAARAKTLVEAGWDADDVAEYVGLPKMAFSKPEKAAPMAPNEPESPERPRGGRPSTANDAAARAIWAQSEIVRAEHPTASVAVIAGMVGVSDDTLRRYRRVFSPE